MADVDEPVRVIAHDPAWARLGAELVRHVGASLAGLPVDVAHIGSTAVPGLAAKPVLDIQVGSPPADVRDVLARLVQAGFSHLGQAGVPGREYLRRRVGTRANIHVVARGGRLWNDNILFRDYLADHPDVAARYGSTKRRAAGTAGTLLAYSERKEQIVGEIIRRAREEAARTDPRPDGGEPEDR